MLGSPSLLGLVLRHKEITMPTFHGQIKNGRLKCTTPGDLQKWLNRNPDEWWRGNFKIIGGGRHKKTRPQLGYYCGLLVPEILKELNSQGHTVKIEIDGLKFEIPHNKDTTHALLTAICSRVGDDGDVMRMSDDDMTVERMMRRIDNVIDFAVNSLSMNAKALEARKPG